MKMPKVEFEKRSTKEWLVGSYDWGYLCKPVFPYRKGATARAPPKFFARDDWLGIFTAILMGLQVRDLSRIYIDLPLNAYIWCKFMVPFLHDGKYLHIRLIVFDIKSLQHALAMCGGLITVPYLLGSNATKDKSLTPEEASSYQQYLISASLIVCGITTMIQVTGIPLPFNRQWGAGILSVMGISFTSYAAVDSTMKTLQADGNTFVEAFGYILGTAACCAVVPILISFLPHRVIKKLFPPIVCGITIVLIGVNLTGVGIRAWGGGAFCADNAKGLYPPITGCMVTNTTTGQLVNSTNCYAKIPINCAAGEVFLPYGSPQFVGLGFSVFSMIILIEIFGSPFLRNCAVVIALMFGYMLAGVTRYNGLRYVTGTKIDAAPAITFLWVKTFPLKVYGPLVLPFLIVFIITSIETVGDVSATEEASFLATSGPTHEKRVRGALLNDGIGGIFSSLATSLPLTTFAQNNGVIALTAVASRQAGWACAGWLFLFGLLGKVGGLITTIPDCVIGGMTTFLFANVIASGIKIMVGEHLTRRNRFIMAVCLGLGLGVTLVPAWATNALWPCTNCSSGLKGLRDAIITVLSTGFCIGAILAIILNLILPQESPMVRFKFKIPILKLLYYPLLFALVLFHNNWAIVKI